MLDNVHLLDNVILFENIKTSIDNIHSSLVFPSNILDELRNQCLQIIFRCLRFVTRKILDDHFKDCKYANPQVSNKTKRLSVNAINNITEENFGTFDRLMGGGNECQYDNI